MTVALLELVLVFGSLLMVKDPLLDPDELTNDSQVTDSVADQVTLLVTAMFWFPPEALGFQVVGDTANWKDAPA